MHPLLSRAAAPSTSGHRWTFFRRGGLDQAALLSAADLQAIASLDFKLWVALACPVKGLELDERTLALLDADGDGRIRASEVVAAVQWASARLKDPGQLLQPADTLPLASIQDQTPEGRALLAAARRVLQQTGEPAGASLGLPALADPAKIFPAGRINGDGIIAPEAASDPATRRLIEDIVTCYGPVKSPTGAAGVQRDQIGPFRAELQAYCDWVAAGSAGAGTLLGEQTEAAYNAVDAVRAKVDDFFTRCRIAGFDPRAQPALGRTPDDFLILGPRLLSAATAELAAFPLAAVGPGRALPLVDGVNPAWAGALTRLRHAAVAPVFGATQTELSEAEWTRLQARLAPYAEWLKAKPASAAQALGPARAREILTGSGQAGLDALLAQDAELAPAFAAFGDLERLIRYGRDLRTLLHNFVNFSDFYSRDQWAVFQAGVLYLDSRSCELCIRLEDPAAHSTLAALSSACIAYLECKRPGAALKIAACFTQGDSDYLFVGRNGVFYDRQGRDWDATIVKLIDNPISIRQAFLAPYKKFIRFIEEQTAKRAAAAEAANEANETALAAGQAAAPPAPRKLDIGTVAALGVAVGGITSALALLFGYLQGWKIPLGLAGLVAVISGPSVLIAWLKIRQRTLGPILEASGWAINGRVRITMPLGRALTDLARVPAGTSRRLDDPYKERSRGWIWFVLVVVLALAAFGYVRYFIHR